MHVGSPGLLVQVWFVDKFVKVCIVSDTKRRPDVSKEPVLCKGRLGKVVFIVSTPSMPKMRRTGTDGVIFIECS